jgi:hypothetical protein
MSIDPGLFRSKEAFLCRVAERLWRYPSDFRLAMQRIRDSEKTVLRRKAAGVLVPLLFKTDTQAKGGSDGTFVFQLIKRSVYVPQPGDLSCPGGMIHPFLDYFLRLLLLHGPLSVMRGPVRSRILHSETTLQRIVTLFLANALRESWEEIRLPPCKVRFLGPLPTYSLLLFRRTIFPLVGLIEGPELPRRPNREVEKIVEIPLTSFFQEESLGCYSLSVPDPNRREAQRSVQYPCLIHREPDDTEEILWGATLHILTQFLRIVLDYRLPSWRNGRVIQKALGSDYRTGQTSS